MATTRSQPKTQLVKKSQALNSVKKGINNSYITVVHDEVKDNGELETDIVSSLRNKLASADYQITELTEENLKLNNKIPNLTHISKNQSKNISINSSVSHPGKSVLKVNDREVHSKSRGDLLQENSDCKIKCEVVSYYQPPKTKHRCNVCSSNVFIGNDETKENEAKKKEEVNKVSYFSLYRYATSQDKIMIAIAVLVSLIGGTGTPIMMIFFGDITGQIISSFGEMHDESLSEEERLAAGDELMTAVSNFAMYSALLALGTFIVTYIATLFFSLTCVRQVAKIRALYIEKVLNQDVSWYDVNNTGEFSSRITEDLSKIEEGIGDKMATFTFFISSFLTGLIVAFVWGWELALMCLVYLPLSSIAMGLVAWLTTKFAQQEMQSYGAAGAIAEEVLGAIKTVFAFGGQQKEINRYSEHLITACKNNIRRALLTAISNGLMWFFMYGSYALSFFYGIKLIVDEMDLPVEERTYTPATMITVFFSILMSTFTLGQCAPYIQIFGISQGAASKIFAVIDNTPTINLSKGNGTKLNKLKGHIRFKDVHFNYPSREDVKILRGVNITINPGETIALVGSSGCGKSTCIQLLQRFYDPLNGEVFIDDVNVKDFDLTWLRSNIGVVGQEPVLFAMTIAENIKFGNQSANQEDIEKAAKKANAHSFISALPDGYNTVVGERGSQMSGGQKQRIAIARALVREPAILLLDEATSALDTNSEAQVQRAIDSVSKECTTVIVAHRLSTIRNANKIIVFSEGKIVEEGKHDDLMELKGVYYDLVINQVSANDLSDTGAESTYKVDNTEEEDIDKINETNTEEDTSDDQGGIKFSTLTKLMKMNRPEWWQIVIGAIGALISGAALPVYAIVFGEVLGVLGNEDPEFVRTEGNMYSLYFLLIGIACGIATFLQWYFIGIAGEKLTKRVRGIMFENILRQEVGWYDRKENGVGAVCARLSTDAANIQGAAGHPIIVALNSVSTLAIAIGLSLYFEWRLALVSMSVMPVIFIGTYFETRISQMSTYGNKNAIENSTKIAVEAVSNIRTVASLGCEEVFQTLYATELIPHYVKGKKSAHFRGFILGMSRSLMFVSYAIALYYGGVLIVEDNLNYTNVFKVAEALISGAWAVGSVMAFSPNFQKGLIAANKMFKLLSRVPEIRDGPNSTSTGWTKGHIKYEQISFSYPTRASTNVLNSLDLSVAQGKTVALVGPSGCGKSTIIQLLQRFYDPNSGVVRIDDVNLKDIKIMALRSHLGIVSQEPNLFDRTIAENIAYGDNSRVVTTQEIMEAAKNANIHNFISSLPTGYETRLGDKGTQLSGGQKQRVAIARALVRNPQVLLLDEATSALDTESEKIVQEALDKAKQGRTCITIAHRLTTIQDADLICVMNKGSVVEQGTHEQLLILRGLYHKLYSMQMRRH